MTQLNAVILASADFAGAYKDQRFNYRYIGDLGTVRLEANGEDLVKSLTGRYIKHGTQSLYGTASGGTNIIKVPLSEQVESHDDPFGGLALSNMNGVNLVLTPGAGTGAAVAGFAAACDIWVWADVQDHYQVISGDWVPLFN